MLIFLLPSQINPLPYISPRPLGEGQGGEGERVGILTAYYTCHSVVSKLLPLTLKRKSLAVNEPGSTPPTTASFRLSLFL